MIKSQSLAQELGMKNYKLGIRNKELGITYFFP